MAQAKQSLWRRAIVKPIAHQFTQGITPEKIALTLAVGSACALFPILGTTTILCLLVGIALRLNQPAIQLVNGVCTPLHLPVILGLYHLGNRLFGVPVVRGGGIRYFSTQFWFFWDHPRDFLARSGELIEHLVVAWAIIAPFWIALVFFVTLPVLREIDALKTLSRLHRPDGDAEEKPPARPPAP